jgi:hypothetical protein
VGGDAGEICLKSNAATVKCEIARQVILYGISRVFQRFQDFRFQRISPAGPACEMLKSWSCNVSYRNNMNIDPIDKRSSEFMTLIGQIDHLGLVVLCALSKMYPEPVRSARLALMTKVVGKTLQPVLDACELHGYASRTGISPHESWHITTLGVSVLFELIASTAASTARLPSPAQPALPFNSDPTDPVEPSDILDMSRSEKNFFSSLSSSSDLIRSDLKEEEENGAEEFFFSQPAQQAAVLRWLEAHNVTGPKRTAVVDDLQQSNWITVARLQSWLDECLKQKSHGFRFRSSPLIYAVTCCLHHDEPPAAPIIASSAAPAAGSSSLEEAARQIKIAEDNLRQIEQLLAQQPVNRQLKIDRQWAELELLKARRAQKSQSD